MGLGVSSVGNFGSQYFFDLVAYDAVIQGTWAQSVQNTKVYNMEFDNVAAMALNDRVDYHAFMTAGTYSFVFVIRTGADYGKIHVLIDDVDVGSVDGYSAGDVDNVVKTISSVSVGANGLKKISLKLTDKNAASGGYYAVISSLSFHRTA